MKLKNIKVNYTMVPNEWLRSGLSFKAVGLIVLLQSLPDDWDFSIEGLAAIAKDGKDAIRSAFKELEEAGFVKRSQAVEKGRFSHNIVELSVVGSTVVGKPVVGKPHTINKRLNNKEEQKKENNVVTNVTTGETPKKEEFGDPNINEMFDEWEIVFGFQQKQSKDNRRACSNLLKRKGVGKDNLKKLIRARAEADKDRYAPKEVRSIVDFKSLQSNLPYLIMWARRKYSEQQEQKGVIEI